MGEELSVALKGWFGGGSKKQTVQELSIDDLIVVERYDEAADRLRAKLKNNPDDLHSHLKLAEVYTELKQYDRAVDEYGFVAEEYAEDGFYDKGLALLTKAARLAPLDPSLKARMDKIQREKSMEQVRLLALEGLRKAEGQGTSALELQRLWHNLVGSTVVKNLSGEQLERLFSNMRLTRHKVGDVLANEKSQESTLYLLITGVVEATITIDGRAMSLRNFTSGDVLGEIPLLSRGEWPANYKVTEAVTALRLEREGLEKALLGNSDPRGLLDVLRGQGNDKQVAASASRLRGA
jgi:tetratricopeptide (TPR) repeat protein